MSIKFRITKCLAVSALAMLLLGACSKNNIYIDLADPNEENGNGHPSGNDSGKDNGNPSTLHFIHATFCIEPRT